MEAFAKDWIYELMNQMGCLRTAYAAKNDGWEKSVEFAIELRAWRECYRKVSQLCHKIGGETLAFFEEKFPDGLDSYKNENLKF